MPHFILDKSGSIAAVAAVCLVPVMLSVGCAIDYARLAQVRDAVQAIADTGAITAVRDEHNSLTEADLETAAKSQLDANAGLDPRDIGLDFNVKVTIDKTTKLRTAKVTYSGSLPTTFMALAGIETMPIAGSASASAGLMPDTDFYFLLDTSDSMGLAATEDARTKLKAVSKPIVGETCEFACHTPQYSKVTLLSTARSLGVKLRIDVARDGIKTVVDMSEAAALKDGTDNRYALTTFSSKLIGVSDLSDLAPAFKAAVNGVDLGYGMGSKHADTLWETTASSYLTELGRLTSAGGPSTANKVVVLITDGLRSQYGGGGTDAKGRKLIRPFDLDQCKAIKDAGYTLSVVYTMYYDIPYNPWYQKHVKPIRADLETNLKACASPGFFAVGDTPGEIQKAFESIFRATRKLPHLTG